MAAGGSPVRPWARPPKRSVPVVAGASPLGRGSCPEPARFQPNLLSLPPAPSTAPAALGSFGSVWLPPASSRAGQPCAAGTWVLLEEGEEAFGGSGETGSAQQAPDPSASSNCLVLLRSGIPVPWSGSGQGRVRGPGDAQEELPGVELEVSSSRWTSELG